MPPETGHGGQVITPVPETQPEATPALLHEVFEQAARQFPDAIAIEVPPGPGRLERTRISYAEAESRANALAARLAAHLAGEAVVAILLPRTTHDVYLAQLAVLKAGGAYTHLDPAAPADRLKYLLDDSAAVAVVTSRALRGRVEALGVPSAHIVEVDGPAMSAGANGHGHVVSRPRWLGPATLAYVIYTSGTSGRPKGVMVEHRNVLNLVCSDRSYFNLGPGDRVGQSSSVAYDSSVEEIWLAFGRGGTVVLMDDEVVRLGPDLVPWLRSERLTVFCPPPTLLRMCACDDPQRDLPELRLLYVGGEELPADVAARWAPGRRLENGYGPTECSITVVRTPVRAGERVTIGHPVEGNHAWILDDELNEVAAGVAGELCIGGRGVTRGYLGAPALTAERYVEHPRFGRIYRTGDLAERLPSGALAYLGRSDSQVKIRGHRVELAAIESSLSSCAGVVAAACRLQGAPSARELAAFLVTDGAGPPDLGHVRERMRELLPEHMQPVHYAVVPALPTRDASGKLDRSALPDIGPETRRSRPLAPARDALERAICEAIAAHLSAPGPVSIDQDFFMDLGGNSLVAAQVISTLRRRADTASLTVRDIYEARTVAQLARRAVPPAAAAAAKPEAAARARVAPAPGAFVQLAWIGGTVAIGAALTYGAVFRLLPALEHAVGRVPLLLALPLLGFAAELAWLPLSLLLTVAAKTLLVGRYRAGRHAYMSAFHVRHWIVQQCARTIPWMLIEGTELQNASLRALGARVGRDVHLHRGADVGGGWDLLEIGDGATLGRDCSLGPVEFDRRELVLAPVHIGPGATLDTRAHVAGGARIERDGFLGALSLLPEGAVLATNERWDGVPAARIDAAPAAAATAPGWGAWPHALTLVGLRGALTIVPLLPGLALAALCLGATRPPGAITLPVPLETLPPVLLPVLFVAGYALSLPVEALMSRMLGRIRTGTFALRGWTGIAASLKDCMVERANAVLSGTLLWPMWLRAAGARVGQRCEISTIMEVIPELLEVGDECFFADGIYLGRPLLHRGTLACAPTRLSSNTFLGNHVVVPAGAALPPDILLGICTVADPARIRPGTSWFGLPAFELPRREVTALDRDLTHEPTWPRVLNRVCFEWARLALPLVPALLAWGWFLAVPQWRAGQSALRFFLFTLPLGSLAAGAVLCGLAIAVKWLVLGPIREGRHALWSCWCCRWDLLYEVWAGWAGPVIAPFEGTPFVSWWLRAMGCRIGHGVVFGSAFLQVVDPDMLVIEDGATVACHVQSHSFEDRVLKLAPVRIGAGSTVGRGAVLLYGADIGDGASVGDNSIVMKHESLLPRLRYVGCPTRAAAPAGASA